MNDQDSPADEAHVYIPKDERSTPDTEGHGRRSPQARTDGSDQLESKESRPERGNQLEDADTEGHGFRRGGIEDAEPDATSDTEGHGFRRGRITDADAEGDDDTEGHGFRRGR